MVRPQKVSVDVWKMILGSCSYLALAFAAWVFLKLVTACFWLPSYLRKEEDKADTVKSQKVDDFNEALLKYQERRNKEGEREEAIPEEDIRSLYALKVNSDDCNEYETENDGKLPDKKNK